MESQSANANVVLVTGPSGAGRTTAINAFEDLGYETIDKLPLSLIFRVLDGAPLAKNIAIGMDVHTRDFSVKSVLDVMKRIGELEAYSSSLLYVDCSDAVLLRRYSETRRRHPAAPDDNPKQGIEEEKMLLLAIQSRADVYIDTSELTPHELRSEIASMFGEQGLAYLAVNLQSFSYKRGVPRGIDMVIDCRFLRNPYWDESLRGETGQNSKVGDYIKGDARYQGFFEKLESMTKFLLPAYREEGKSHFTIGLGCTGGQHRSVFVAEALAEVLTKSDWKVSVRHREMERRSSAKK